MALKLGELVAVISAEDSGFRRVLGRVHSGLQSVGKIGALASLAGSATHLAVALAPAAGIVAALPGAFIAAKVAGAALALALTGVSDALGTAVSGDMEAFKEQLEGMPPSARAVVGELGVAFAGLQATAQSNFFKPMAKSSRGLGKELQGPVHRGIATITASMGRFGEKVIDVAREGRSLSFMRSLSVGIARGLDGASKGVKPLLRGIRDIAGVGVGQFGRAGDALGRLMTRFGEWLSAVSRGGQATGWINNAVTTLKTMGRIGRNVALTLGQIFKNADAGASGGLLVTIEQLTARMLEWSQSAEGQQQIATFFQLLNDTASSLATILPLLVGPLGMVVSLIQALPAPAQESVSQFLAWSIVIAVIVSRLAPLARGLVLVGKAAGAVGSGIGRGFGALAGQLRNADSGTRRAASRIGSAFGTAARGAQTAAAAAGRAAVSFMTAAGRMALAMSRAALSVLLSGLKMAGAAALAAARVVAGWALMGLQALLNAAKVAAAWVIAMGPVGWIVAAAIAAVALIIANWDKVKKFFVETLPKFLKRGFDFIVGLIKKAAKFGFLGPVGLIISHWDKIKKFFTETLPKAIGDGFNRVVGWLTGLPSRVVNAVGDMAKLLVNAGKNILIGLWNGLVSMSSWLARSIGNLVKKIVPGPVLRVLGIASPSKLFAGYGENLAQGLAQGMTGNTGIVSDAAATLAGAAETGAGGLSRPARGGRRGGAGGRDEIRLRIDFTGADGAFKTFMRKIVRVDGRGTAAVAFGTGGK